MASLLLNKVAGPLIATLLWKVFDIPSANKGEPSYRNILNRYFTVTLGSHRLHLLVFSGAFERTEKVVRDIVR